MPFICVKQFHSNNSYWSYTPLGFVFFNIILFFISNILLVFFFFLAVLGLRCCTQAFSSCGERGLLFVAVRGLLIAVASLVVEQGL